MNNFIHSFISRSLYISSFAKKLSNSKIEISFDLHFSEERLSLLFEDVVQNLNLIHYLLNFCILSLVQYDQAYLLDFFPLEFLRNFSLYDCGSSLTNYTDIYFSFPFLDLKSPFSDSLSLLFDSLITELVLGGIFLFLPTQTVDKGEEGISGFSFGLSIIALLWIE